MTTKKTNVHLVIVTGQAQANLIAILQLKPDVIVLAISDDMEKNASGFIDLLKSTIPNIPIQSFSHIPDVGVATIEAKAKEIAEQLQYKFPQGMITYHATGGNKLMMLGFCEIFSTANNEVIYTHTAHGHIEFIYPRHKPVITIEPVLDMKTYLRSLGEQYKPNSNNDWETIARNRKNLTFWLGNKANQLGGFFKTLNAIAMSALADFDKGCIQSNQRLTLKKIPALWLEALKKLANQGICEWNKTDTNSLIFNNAACARYLGGIWLEEYVWLIASELNISEVTANVEFTELASANGTVLNEIDCIAVHNNHLLIIECKTVAFKEKATKNSDILYKLNTLGSRAGGLYGDKWLVSASPLDKYTQSRAETYKIKTIAAEQLKNLKTELENWRDAKR